MSTTATTATAMEATADDDVLDCICDATISVLKGIGPTPLGILRRRALHEKNKEGITMKLLLKNSLRNKLIELDSKYKKRAFKQALAILERKQLITKDSETDSSKCLISLNVKDDSNGNKSQGDVTILLFYAYCPQLMTRAEQEESIKFCFQLLSSLGVTGRLRIAREGFNATLTGSTVGIRKFTQSLRVWNPSTFGETDFKYVDGLPANQMLKGLKVWPVTEIVTYGFDPSDAPLDKRGTHLTPEEFHKAMANENSIMIDVRNFNETLIGKFNPPTGQEKALLPAGEKVLDPCMRKSTEFPEWVEKNKEVLQGKQVLMYCTGGVRCERASAYLRHRAGIENVYQLEGGIHRYLEAFPKDGGFWVGKNYTFDKRFSHGAENAAVISSCVHCGIAWDRYQAQKTCANKACKMEIILCKTCQRMKPPIPNTSLFCPLCKAGNISGSENESTVNGPKKRKLEESG